MREFINKVLIILIIIAIPTVCVVAVYNIATMSTESIIEDIGKTSRDIKDSFNKGYNDTTKTK